MDSRRALLSLFVLAALTLAPNTPLVAKDPVPSYLLKGSRPTSDLTRVEIGLQVGGDLKLVTDGKPNVLPMSVVANLDYDERILAADATGRPSRSVRYYNAARAVIKVDKGGERPELEPAHRMIRVDKPEKSAAVLYSPAGALKREELDLIDLPGNTLLVDDLLPGKTVALGESWKLGDQALAGLLGIEAVNWTDVQSVLGEVVDGVADIAAAGSVSGAVGGVSTEIELKAKYKFDLKLKRITFLALLIKEKRAVGHIGPGLDTVAKVIMKISPISASEHLTSDVVARLGKSPTAELSQLSYSAPSGTFQFQYDRRWYLTSDDPKMAVLRLMDRGELVAQCNMSALPVDPKKTIALAEFQSDVQKSLGKNFGQFASASESTNEAGCTVFRVVAQGTVSQLPISWIYYLIANEKGQRVTVSFTYEQTLEDRFANADRLLVGQVRLTDSPVPTAARATTTK